MILFKKAADLRKWLDAQDEKEIEIGFVPTMGALHQGHISLVRASKEANPVTVCSIFVNPTQFNDPTDFKKYPITIETDISMLEEAGCDILFLPSVDEVYPDRMEPKQHYDLGHLEEVLEGKFRPGHFQGVCMVVHRLLEIVQPSNLYLGQKDYQQCMVITRLAEVAGLTKKPVVNICPTLREPDGLAMSSRNMRLNENERATATAIYRALTVIREGLTPGDLHPLKNKARTSLEAAGFRVDYIEIAGAGDLSIIEHWDGQQQLVALGAAFINEVRLIDNMLLN